MKSELLNLYNTSDFGLVASLTNISLVPYEMLATGLPIIEFKEGTFEYFFPENTAIITSFDYNDFYKKVKESIPPLQSGIDSLFVLIYISVLLHMRCGALRAPCGCRARRGTRRTGALQSRSHATCAGNPAFASA